MGEIINLNFNNKQEGVPAKNEAIKNESAINKPANIIEFKDYKEAKEERAKDKEILQNIIEKSHKNKDGTYAVKLNIKLETFKREALKQHLMNRGLHFYSIDNKTGSVESNIGLDLDIRKDQLPELLEFFKDEGVEYSLFQE